MKTIRVLPLLIAVVLVALSPAQPSPPRAKNDCHAGEYRFKGAVTRGQTFSHAFDGFLFELVPTEYGWGIDISRGSEQHLASMTGPHHFVPNATEIEGWHFRNAANTGPNTGDVNAPDETRKFLFSARWPHCQDAEGLDKDGKGTLDITDVELGNLKEGEKATIIRMEFSVALTVGHSACTPCPGARR